MKSVLIAILLISQATFLSNLVFAGEGHPTESEFKRPISLLIDLNEIIDEDPATYSSAEKTKKIYSLLEQYRVWLIAVEAISADEAEIKKASIYIESLAEIKRYNSAGNGPKLLLNEDWSSNLAFTGSRVFTAFLRHMTKTIEATGYPKSYRPSSVTAFQTELEGKAEKFRDLAVVIDTLLAKLRKEINNLIENVQVLEVHNSRLDAEIARLDLLLSGLKAQATGALTMFLHPKLIDHALVSYSYVKYVESLRQDLSVSRSSFNYILGTHDLVLPVQLDHSSSSVSHTSVSQIYTYFNLLEGDLSAAPTFDGAFPNSFLNLIAKSLTFEIEALVKTFNLNIDRYNHLANQCKTKQSQLMTKEAEVTDRAEREREENAALLEAEQSHQRQVEAAAKKAEAVKPSENK